METRNLKILAIDDNPDNLTALKAVMQDFLPGCTLLTALNGIRGIELAHRSDPDVILLDLVMPGMDGFAVCRRLKADERLSSIPVVFLTALKTDRESRVRALQAGGDGFLTKPPDESELIAAIQAMAKVKAANRVQRLEREQLAEMVAERTVELKQSRQATLSLLEDLTNENEARKRTERELRDNQAELNKAQQIAGVGSWKWHIPSNRLSWSDEMYRIFGIDPQRFTGDLADVIASAVHPEDRDAVEQANRSVLDERMPKPLEYRVIWPDGTVRVVWAEAGELVLDETGQASVLSGVVQDVTERKRAEAALRENETMLRSITDSARDAILMLDSQGKISFWNPAAEKILGYRSDEALGSDLLGLLTAETDRAAHRGAFSEFLRTGRGKAVGTTLELTARRKDDRRITVALSLSSLCRHGSWHAVGILRDITEAKQVQETLRETRDYLENMFSHANAPIVVWDPSFKITRFNQAFETLTGISAAEALGQSLEIVFATDSRDYSMDLIRLTCGECWDGQEISIFNRKTGTIRLVLWNSASIFGSDGTTLEATIAQGIDITERRHAEDALRKTLRERETLLKEVHHRVKNNLQIITSLMSLQARRDHVPEVMTAFRTMENRIRSMAMLHEALYRSEDLARIDFKPYIERLCGHLANSLGADAKCIHLETHVSGVMLPLERAVPCGLLVNELVTNVFKHAFPDGRLGRATVSLEAEADGKLVLTVADDGVGLPATQATTQANSLGLELVRGLTQQLEGTLSVDRGTPGTVFRVTFPASLDGA